MNTMETIHWTEDESRLDAYVLGRLSEQQRTACDQHSATCRQCRSAVERHKRLVNGIKAAGRMNAKRRLAANVQNLRVRRDGQRMIFRAAAAVIIAVVGFSVYRVWIAGHQETALPAVELHDSVQLKPPSAESRDRGQPKPSSVELKKVDQLGDEASSKRVQQDQRTPSTDKSLPVQPSKAEASEAAGVAAAAPEPERVVVTAARPIRSDETTNRTDAGVALKKEKDAPAAAGLQTVEEDRGGMIWIAGSYVRESPRSQQSNFKALTIEEKSAPSEKRAKGGGQTLHGPVVVQQFLSQQSIVTEQQTQQTTGDVRALAELRGDSLILSIDVVPPAAAGEIAAWRGHMVGSDSVVVTVRGRAIGFRLPPELVRITGGRH